MRARPLVAVSACVKTVEGFDAHSVGAKYIDALLQAAEVAPLIVPAIGFGAEVQGILKACDGLYLTGSVSNVMPDIYGDPPSVAGTSHDPARDATTLPMIRYAVEHGLPMFAICRGFQEMNVALGGTLHQRVQEVDGYMDHREDQDLPVDLKYAPAHQVALTPGGLLAEIAGETSVRVNSLHGQGIDRLADGLVVEACAPDGLIEAACTSDADAFGVGVQWHPEWNVMDNSFAYNLFARFGAACRDHVQKREDGGKD